MANYYDSEAMKNGASKMEKEIAAFNKYRSNIDSIIDKLAKSWDDDNNRKYVALYRKEAANSMEDASKKMTQYAELLKMCSRKYGNSIDSGNSNLTI